MVSISAIESKLNFVLGQLPKNLHEKLQNIRDRIDRQSDRSDGLHTDLSDLADKVDNHTTRLGNQNDKIQAQAALIADLQARVAALELRLPLKGTP